MILTRKLIVEQPFFDVESEIVQEGMNSEKKLYFKGQYLMLNQMNKNGRVYEEDEMLPAIQTFNENYIQKHRAGGELNHSAEPEIKLERLAHKIIDLKRDYSNPNFFIGKSEVLTSNPSGKILEGLIKHNMKFGLSSKCLGQIEESSGIKLVKNPIILSVDAVYEPSANTVFVDGILESKEYIIGNDGKVAEAFEKFEKKLSKYPSKHRNEINNYILENFKQLLNNIK